MNLAEETPVAPPARMQSGSAPPSLRGLWLILFAAGYGLLFCVAVPSFVDEAYSFNVATDSSLSHLFSALRGGADGSFPLYALIIWTWEKIFGPSELSLRLNSGMFVILFVWQSSWRLTRHFGPGVAGLAVFFVLADEFFEYFSLQARFYGLVIFLFSLCFWSTWDLLQGKSVPAWQRISHGLFCGLLCLSHPFGLIYTAALGLLYVAFAECLKRFSLASALSFLGGPALFLFWLPSFLHQRLVNPVYAAGPPGWLKYWQFAFLFSKLLFFAVSIGLTFLVSVEWFSRFDRKFQTGNDRELDLLAERTGTVLLVRYALAFIAVMNGVVALLDWVHVIPLYWMKGVRYLLVCWVAYGLVLAGIMAGIAKFLERKCPPARARVVLRTGFSVLFLCLLALMAFRWHRWAQAKAQEESFLAHVSKTANEQHLTVVCDDYLDAFYLATRTPAAHVVYLLEEGYPFARFLLQAAKYYPHPKPIYPYQANVAISAQLHSTNSYLFLRGSLKEMYMVNPHDQRANDK